MLVEQTDLVQNALAVKGRAAAGREHPARLLIAADLHAVAPLAGKAQNGDVVARVVGQVPLKMADHQAAHRKNALVCLGRRQQIGQPVRLGEGIVVEQRHKLALRGTDALVHRVGEAGVFGVFDEGVVCPAHIAAGDGKAFVGGAVVHHDEFKILFGLGPDGLDGVPQPARAVQIGDHNGGFHGAPPFVAKVRRGRPRLPHYTKKRRPGQRPGGGRLRCYASASLMEENTVSWFSHITSTTSPDFTVSSLAALAMAYWSAR